MFAAAILAGGQGRRLGGAVKSFVRVEGRPIVERQLEVLRPLFDRIVVVARDRADFDGRGLDVDLEVIIDRRAPGLGPLAGLEAVLSWLPGPCESVVCVAGDMPYLCPAVVAYLRDVAPATALATVPVVGERLQPLCARYHRGAAPLITAALDGGTRAMMEFLAQLEGTATEDGPALRRVGEEMLARLEPRLLTFSNINRLEDLPPAHRS